MWPFRRRTVTEVAVLEHGTINRLMDKLGAVSALLNEHVHNIKKEAFERGFTGTMNTQQATLLQEELNDAIVLIERLKNARTEYKEVIPPRDAALEAYKKSIAEHRARYG